MNLQKLPDLRAIIQIGETATSGLLSFEDVCRRGSTVPPPRVKLRFDDPINIQFTSGTTGAPKGATLTRTTSSTTATSAVRPSASVPMTGSAFPSPSITASEWSCPT